jgi:hypothetical protein
MTTNLRNFIELRRTQILEQISALKAELQELKLADAAIRTGIAGSATVTKSNEEKSTIKQMVIEVLQGRPEGADSSEIVQFIKQEFGEDVARSSLSPQLSRLKEEGKAVLNGKIWRLSEFDNDPNSDKLGSSIEDFGEKLKARDSHIDSPYDSSLKSAFIHDSDEDMENDIPF